MKYLLGIDNGGSDIKCAIFDLEGNETAVAARNLPIETPGPGFTERDANEVWKANVEVIREALSKAHIDPEEIAAIGITAYGNGLVFADEKVEPVYPAIVSTDDRASEYVKRFKSDGTERKIFPHTRQTIWSAQPAVLLPWFRDNKPEVLSKTRWVLSLKDFIRYRLTGELYGELTEASSTSLMDLNSESYDPFIFETLGIEDCLEKFPKIRRSTQIAGYLTKEAAKLSGLKEGTPVAAGFFDIDANALGSGILSDEELCLIAGTWSINEFLTSEATTDYDKRTNTATLSYIDGLYLMEDSTPTSASNFNWYINEIIKKYNKDLSNEEIYSFCNELVEKEDPCDSSVIFVPYLYGSATHPDAHGAFLNISAADDDAAMLRAIYEGVVFSSVHHVHNLQREISTYKKAKLSGGVSNSSVWSQMMADALQIPIETLEGSQTGARGAVIGAGVACGIFKDLEEGVRKMVRSGKTYEPREGYAEIYRKKYAAYEAALEAVDLLAQKVQVI
ncbi:MAG: carbohydrate kinase [Erysipelotrichaceae bacterium]|nr:carbohydrate kinase [Erysipelotrichaceae bacterium]